MNADRPVSRVRDWLNPRLNHRDICVHRRSSAAKIPFFWINQPKPNAAQQGPGLVHPHAAAMPAQTAPFKPSRIDPMNREPAAKPGSTAPFKPFRIDPMNREPTAKPAPTVPFKPPRIDPMNREPTGPSTAPSVAASKALSAAATAPPAHAHDPAPAALTLPPSPKCPVRPDARPAKPRLPRRGSRFSLTQ
jgi:hypothetical protein